MSILLITKCFPELSDVPHGGSRFAIRDTVLSGGQRQITRRAHPVNEY